MSEEHRINYEKLAGIWRYCPNCDPRVLNPIQCANSQCTCGHNLCVVTEVSGKLVDNGQYKGSRERYSQPVALVTGKPTHKIPTVFTSGEYDDFRDI